MSYRGGDDPQLVADLRAALKRWHRSTIGEVAIASRLGAVSHRHEANPRLTRAAALREVVLEALSNQRESGQASHADLLRDRYFAGESVHLLQHRYHLSERSLYYRLNDALVSLAHALWAIESDETGARPVLKPSEGQTPAQWRARHLPPPTYTFLLGAEDVLAHLLRCLNMTGGHWMISVDGMGGLGKTAVVREAAARIAETDRFADIAWLTVTPDCYPVDDVRLDLHHSLTCDQVSDGIGAQLGGLDLSPLPPTRKRERVWELLRARPYLVVVDNLEMIAEYETALDLLRGLANPSKFLFTSRCRMSIDEYPWTVVPLAELGEKHGLGLIRHEAYLRGLEAVTDASDGELGAILAVTGGNPLAIKLVVGQLVSLPLRRVLTDLEGAHPSSDAFYDYVFSASWDLLSESARSLLLCLAQLPTTGGTWHDLSVVTGDSDEVLASAIGELTAHSLIESPGLEEKTYSIHPLTHHFAARQAASMIAE